MDERSLDDILDRFESEWTSDIRLQEYVELVAANQRSSLVQGLLEIDLELRLKSGEQLNLTDLEKRFPGFEEAVREAFSAVHRRIGVSDRREVTAPSTARTKQLAETIGVGVESSINETSNDSGRRGVLTRNFGEYELLEEIARGGMGVVYKARHNRLNRIVALKMILSGELAGEEEVKRFHGEAEAAANLDHPGIVPIYEIGEHQGQYYFSMGFVDGESLQDKLRDGPLAAKEAASLCRKVAEAVAYAHEKGVIHRDLKPANVLLDTNGEVKVTDFGLAKRVDSDSDLTRTGAVMGTPNFMPPEQASGKTDEVGPKADVYSLGAILYCVVTGRPPFQAAGVIDVLRQVIDQEPVAPRILNPAIDIDLETICLKCLEKNQDKRYASAETLVEDLTRYLDGRPITARPVSQSEQAWRWCRRHPAAASAMLAVIVLLVVSVGAFFWVNAARTEAVRLQGVADTQTAVAEKERNFAKEAASQLEASLSRSNYYVALARWKDGNVRSAMEYLRKIPPKHRNLEWQLKYKEFQGSDITCFGHLGAVHGVAFSPDGTRIASAGQDKTIRVWNGSDGTELMRLSGHDGPVRCVGFSRDGVILASGSSDKKIKLWDAKTGEERGNLVGDHSGIDSISFNHDGTKLISGHRSSFRGEVLLSTSLWDLRTGKEIQVFDGRFGAFSRNGERMAMAQQYGDVLIHDSQGRAVVKMRRNEDVAGAAWDLAFSPNGQRLAAAWGGSIAIDREVISVTVWNSLSGEEILTLNANDQLASCVTFSPDGLTIASGVDETVQLWDAESGLPKQTLKGHEAFVSSVTVSPDGLRLASGSDDGTVKVWDLRHKSQATVHKKFRCLHLAFSPSGSSMAVTKRNTNTISILDTDTLKQRLAIEAHRVLDLAYHPDGNQIASAGNEGITVWDVSTGMEVTSLRTRSDASRVLYSTDGSKIAAVSSGDVYVWDTASETQFVFEGIEPHPYTNGILSFNPDGTQLVVLGEPQNMIRLLNVVSGSVIATLKGHDAEVSVATYSPDGLRIASGGFDGLKIWDAATGSELSHAYDLGLVTELVFSPDGTRLISRVEDFPQCKGITIWDANSAEELLKLHHDSMLLNVGISPDASRIVALSVDGELVVWDARPPTQGRTQE